MSHLRVCTHCGKSSPPFPCAQCNTTSSFLWQFCVECKFWFCIACRDPPDHNYPSLANADEVLEEEELADAPAPAAQGKGSPMPNFKQYTPAVEPVARHIEDSQWRRYNEINLPEPPA